MRAIRNGHQYIAFSLIFELDFFCKAGKKQHVVKFEKSVNYFWCLFGHTHTRARTKTSQENGEMLGTCESRSKFKWFNQYRTELLLDTLLGTCSTFEQTRSEAKRNSIHTIETPQKKSQTLCTMSVHVIWRFFFSLLSFASNNIDRLVVVYCVRKHRICHVFFFIRLL